MTHRTEHTDLDPLSTAYALNIYEANVDPEDRAIELMERTGRQWDTHYMKVMTERMAGKHPLLHFDAWHARSYLMAAIARYGQEGIQRTRAGLKDLEEAK